MRGVDKEVCAVVSSEGRWASESELEFGGVVGCLRDGGVGVEVGGKNDVGGGCGSVWEMEMCNGNEGREEAWGC